MGLFDIECQPGEGDRRWVAMQAFGATQIDEGLIDREMSERDVKSSYFVCSAPR